MQTLATLRRFRNLATIVPVLFLAAACSQGDGPESIANEPATPLPPTEPGFCDPINFEAECPDPEIVNFNGGATIIVDNPDPSGINTSDRVARMQKFPDEVFGGTLLNLGDPIDFSEGESYTVKVWSPRPVTVSFKLEEQGNPAGGLTVDEDHGGSGSWEELCFDFTGQAVPTPVVALTIIFDNGTLGQADTDPDNWTFYYDDITQVQSCEATGPGDIQPDAALFKSSGAPDLVIPDDYAERTALGSGSVIDPNYADDETFSPVLSVFSGAESGANVAQVGFIGFQEGFLTRYETVDFKVKGMPGFVIFVNLFDGVDALRLNLTSSGYSSELSDGWFQVSIPVADFAGADEATGIVFESDDSAETGFRMLLNDVGFSGTGTHVPADAGVIPEVSLYDRDGTPDLVIPDDFAEITVFGSEAVIDDDFRGDLDFSPALAITTGFGYDIWNAQLAYTGFTPGFATAYETLQFKVKDLSGDVIRVKLLPSADFVDIDVTSSPYATALGNGWFQVELPVADIPGADLSEGLLFETISPAPAESFTYLLTDVGFSGEAPADTTTSVDFEGDAGSFSFDNFGGGESTVIANPDPGGINTSGQVVQMTRTSESDFGGSTLALSEGVDWSQGEIFRMKVWSQRTVPVLFKVEGTPPAEANDSHDGGGVWQELCFDFTGNTAGEPVTGISIFFDLGAVGDVASDPDNWTFFYDDIEQTSEACPVPEPPPGSGDHGPGTAGVFTETATESTVEVTSITNSIDFGGNNTVADPASTAIPAFEGDVVLSIDYQDSGSTFGGAVLNFGGVDLTAFDTLNFTVDTSGIPGFADLTIQIEPPGAGAAGTNVLLSAYTPVATSDNWATYAIPLADFTATNFAAAANLGFWNPTNGSGLAFGTLYVDDVYFSTESGGAGGDHGPGTAGVFTETATESTVEVTSITNSIDFGGNNTVADPASTAIPAFEGDVVLSIDYQDSGSTFGGAVLNFGGVDLTAFDTLNFTVDTSGIVGFADLTIQIEPPGAGAAGTNVLLSAYTPVATSGNWATYAIPLADFTATDFAAAANLGFWNPTNGSGLAFGTLYVDDVYFSTEDSGGGGGGAIGELVINGGFETGDLTGWETSPNGGTITTTSDSSTGNFAANLNITAAGNPTLKAANLGAGDLTAGQEVTVSFDWKGGGANGGVVDVRLFSELTGGGVSATEIILEGAGFPSDWTTVGPLTITTGPDVSGGVTLQFTAICGADAGCVSDIFIDNVSISGEAPEPPVDATTSVDFEGDAGSFSFDNFGGGESTVIANPDPGGINTSGQVVQMTRTSESDFGGSTLALSEGVDWSQGEIFRMKVWSQRTVPVLFKVEGTPPAEANDSHEGGGVWQELCFDFTGNTAGEPVTGISIFFDLGAVGDVASDPDNWTFFYDDIEQTSEACPVPPPTEPEFTTITFDDPETTYTLTDFGGTASTVTNDPDGGANQVVLTVKSNTAASWAGTTVSTLPGEAVPAIPLDADNTRMSVRVFSPDAGIPVRLKIEDASDPGIFVETEALTTTVNAWETLTFDFANEAAGAPAFDPAASYNKVSIFFNFDTDGATAGEKSYYFDDIAVGSGDGAPAGGELLTNGDFEASATDKAPWVNAGGIVENNFYTADAIDGQPVFETNLSQVVAITQGAGYVLNFRAKASVARDIIAGIGLNAAPFTADTVAVPLTTEWQSYSFNLTAIADIGTAESRVLFDMGGVTSDVNIDDVSLTPMGGGAELLTNGDFEASEVDKAPWLNAGEIATNNFYTADAIDGQPVFETNLSQVVGITQGVEYVLSFRARASVARDMIAGIGLNGGTFTAETATVPLTTEWQSYSFNLTAVADIGTAESRVLFDMGGVTSTVNIDDVSLTESTGGGGGSGAVDIAVNGGFESGDFTGWTRFEAAPGDQTINSSAAGDTSSEGVFHLEINNTVSETNSLIKQERVGLGTVTPGIGWTVTFDARGSLGTGGVAFAQVFSETAVGSENCTGCGILGGAPLALNPDPTVWTSFSFSGMAGPNTESLTLQLEAITGASNLANVFYDNITILVGDGGG